MNTSAESLAPQLDTAEWQWLRPHNERGALIIVDSMLELAEVGEKLACDDAAAIQAWLASSLVKKPDLDQISAWNQTPSKLFSMLVISPFVLIQEQQTHK